ncbi:MAG: pentapeptide repeat-containing protein [Candidatus Thiodiazotropha sp. (ex Epidulcina cf. delphinae)]|nr:pentapeptide repeat-containing protein [Candidatus Thiodiazotropha sp. (ex Epidulcina cf. delphinae)]
MRDYRWELIATLAGLLAMVVSPLAAWDKSDLERLHTSSECNGCNLEGADLSGVELKGAKLRWAGLKGVDLRGANLRYADLTGADLRQARLTKSHLEGAILQGSRLTGVDLSETHLMGADLRWADLSHLDVDFALEFVDLIGVLLEGARFSHGVRCGAFPDKGGFGCAAR